MIIHTKEYIYNRFQKIIYLFLINTLRSTDKTIKEHAQRTEHVLEEAIFLQNQTLFSFQWNSKQVLRQTFLFYFSVQ